MEIKVTTPEDQKLVKEYIKQAEKATREADDAKKEVNDIYDVLKTKFAISPTIARLLVKARMKGEVKDVKEAHDIFSDLAEIADGAKQD